MSNRHSQHGHIIERRSEVPRLVVLVFAIAGLVAIITSISLLSPKVIKLVRNNETVHTNVTWMTRAWTQEDHPDEEVAATVEILEDNNIHKVYIQTHVWHGQTGEFIELPYSNNFVQRFRRNATDIALYIWLSVDQNHLFDPDSQQQVIDVAREASLSGLFDGIHLQARLVPDNSEDFITLLRNLRTAVGPQTLLSITVPPDRKPADPDVPSSPNVNDSLTWSIEYKRRVALNVNEMVLMAHASGLEDVSDYENWMAYQVATYSEIIDALDIDMNFIVALPTYEAELGHDPDVENVTSALAGLKDGINRARVKHDQVDGVGLYPWEETDLLELDAYWDGWGSGK